jgi:D-alanyl-D-alanine dipeptidase
MTSRALPAGLVRLADVAPSVRQDIRYAGADNFTGAPVPGYERAECWLLEAAALALARAASDAARRGLGLIVWDGYRPQRASDWFLRWSQAQDHSSGAESLRARFHPRIDRSRLFALGYLSERSSHSRGAAVDLGLVDAAGALVDMGTPFDFFDPASATDSQEAGEAARANRALLCDLMHAQGFRNYAAEWWHFGWPVADGVPFLDAPIR